MSVYSMMLAVAALIAWYFGRKHPRTIVWLAAIALSFIASKIYWGADLPYGSVFAFFCDAALCLALYLAYREKWEKTLMGVFLLSSAVNLVYMMGFIQDQEAYSIALEALNYVSLIIIGGRPLFQKGADNVRRYNPDSGLRHYVARLSLSLWPSRRDKEKRG